MKSRDKARAILAELYQQGIELELSADGAYLLAPARTLTMAQCNAIRTNRLAIIAIFQSSAALSDQLIEAAMRACEHFGDSPAAREQMRLDVLATPAHQRGELLNTLRASYQPRPGQ